MRLAVRDDGNHAPDELHGAIERWIYHLADVNWALWRGLSLSLPITADERRRGGERDFFYTRNSACAACNGIEGYNQACRQCKGKGAVTDNAYARVKIPRRARLGYTITIANGGHEDLNGNCGPLILRLADADASGEPRSAAGKSPQPAPEIERPLARSKRPFDINDCLPGGASSPPDNNGVGLRDINGMRPRDVNDVVDPDFRVGSLPAAPRRK
jgi:hypothetical protein